MGALQACIELGPYNPLCHTLAFFRSHRDRFLPHHYTSPSLLLGLGVGLGLVGGKGAPEACLLEQYKRLPNHTATNTNSRKFMRKYLEFCWSLPFYGAAFFQGQIERPVRGLASWITNRDMHVLIAINSSGVYIVDDVQCVRNQILYVFLINHLLFELIHSLSFRIIRINFSTEFIIGSKVFRVKMGNGKAFG